MTRQIPHGPRVRGRGQTNVGPHQTAANDPRFARVLEMYGVRRGLSARSRPIAADGRHRDCTATARCRPRNRRRGRRHVEDVVPKHETGETGGFVGGQDDFARAVQRVVRPTAANRRARRLRIEHARTCGQLSYVRTRVHEYLGVERKTRARFSFQRCYTIPPGPVVSSQLENARIRSK